jgi:hypothetical protein
LCVGLNCPDQYNLRAFAPARNSFLLALIVLARDGDDLLNRAAHLAPAVVFPPAVAGRPVSQVED